MAVTASPKDSDGVLLQSNITALTTAINTTTSPLHKYQMQLQLDQLQRELVNHYLDTRRILASTILSTLS
jgi:hypothetical protein